MMYKTGRARIAILYNITLSPLPPPPPPNGSNDTLGNTPFQLISDFFHVNQGVYNVVSMLSKLPPGMCWRGGGATGLLNKGGGSNRLPGIVTKQQSVEFP